LLCIDFDVGFLIGSQLWIFIGWKSKWAWWHISLY